MAGTKSVGCMLLGATALLLPLAAYAQTLTTLHSFTGEPDGDGPVGALIDVGGTLYGTTFTGGTHGAGTVFTIDPTTGAETVLHSFTGGGAGLYPEAALLNVSGTLYGTAAKGGTYDAGTVFAVNPATGAVKLVYSFAGGSDGQDPDAALIMVGGMLYGTTSGGGGATACDGEGCGTVFSVNPITGAETVLHAFTGKPDGASPQAALLDVGGTLYGTSNIGGTYAKGTVFTVDPATGAEHVLYSFTGSTDGSNPAAALIDVGGTLYGTTGGGGKYDAGTVFTLDPATGAENVLYSFAGGANGDGGYPLAIIDVGGTLFGTTYIGGTGGSGNGTVFAVNRMTGVETVLHSFSGGSDGDYPDAGLLRVGGTLYGTTLQGGSDDASCGSTGCGTVFSLSR